MDRFGQPMAEVRVITWWGADNPMDGMVFDVLLRKHEAIRKSLGISVPVPEDSEQIMETLINGLLLRRQKGANDKNLLLPGMEDYVEPVKKQVAQEWDTVAPREQKRSGTLFAQRTIRTDAVANALAEADFAVDNAGGVERFVSSAWPLLGGVKKEVVKDGQTICSWHFDPLSRERCAGLDLPGDDDAFVFILPARHGRPLLARTHPLVEQRAAWLAQNSLDPPGR